MVYATKYYWSVYINLLSTKIPPFGRDFLTVTTVRMESVLQTTVIQAAVGLYCAIHTGELCRDLGVVGEATPKAAICKTRSKRTLSLEGTIAWPAEKPAISSH